MNFKREDIKTTLGIVVIKTLPAAEPPEYLGGIRCGESQSACGYEWAAVRDDKVVSSGMVRCIPVPDSDPARQQAFDLAFYALGATR